jgi:hypothetical protein
MRVFRDTASIRASVAAFDDPDLSALVAKRFQELAEYDDYDLGDLVNIFVIEPGDPLTAIDAELGFTLVDRPIDVIENHPCWYELTIVLSDDGFGFVLYVPKQPGVEPDLLAMCAKEHAP